MLKLSKNHTIYEVWCAWAAETVYVDHKPTKEEIEELRKKNWPETDQFDTLQVRKLDHLYTFS